MDKGLYAHFHHDEHRFVDKAWEWILQASEQHAVKRTDFLDPRQGHILETLVNRVNNVTLRLDGGFAGAERKRGWLAPDYRNKDEAEMGIKVLSVSSGDDKFLSLDHGDYMGSILSLGIKRDKIGDIQVLPKGCQCLVAEEISDYLHLHLQQVHRVHVQTAIVSLDKLQHVSVSLEEMNLSVASLRLDGIVSDVFRLSRAKVLVPIKAGRCRVNWKAEEDPSKPLREGDLISMQGFGRFKVLEMEGLTKSGRIRVKVGRFI
jgi:RNA-binding protein YlmH